VPALRGGAFPFPLHRGAAERGIGIQDPAVALEACFRAGRWDPALFPALLSVGRARGNLGELLTKTNFLVEGEAWQFEAQVDPHAFELLGFAEASAGIARTQRENREGWWAHARRNKAFILDAAARIERPRLAVVLGAGKTYDLPIQELAQRFERVLLLDIDADALAATIRERAFGPRVEARPVDVTGVTARIARGIEAALSCASPEDSLEAVCRSYRLASPPQLLPAGEHADLLVSGMVLSQLGLQPKLAAKRLFERRFGAIRRESEARWSFAWDELELRLQQDHINALTREADLAVLTSDIVHHGSAESWSVIGADRLEERIPAFQEIVARASWSWPRIRNAVRTDVHALLLRRKNRSEQFSVLPPSPAGKLL
jgi:hypothetical protein